MTKEQHLKQASMTLGSMLRAVYNQYNQMSFRFGYLPSFEAALKVSGLQEFLNAFLVRLLRGSGHLVTGYIYIYM